MNIYDAVVIGAGVTGSAIARELSRKKGSFLVVEANSDVCEGSSKANSAIIHAGFDAEPGTLKAKMNVWGSRIMPELCEELDIPLNICGAFVVCFEPERLDKLRELYDRGTANGVEGLELLSGDEAREREPNLADAVCGALWAPTSAIVCPFTLTVAMAENANENGVEFRLGERVTGIEKGDGCWRIATEKGEIFTKAVVNAAGVHSDEIHNMVCEDKLRIEPRIGEYCLLDREAGGHVKTTVFQLPSEYGKGVLVSPTVHGNLLLGPTAVDSDDRDSTATTQEGLADVLKRSALSVKNIPTRQVITSFAGMRAHGNSGDFVLRESAPLFFDAAEIESPGLSSAPAVGKYMAQMVSDALSLEEKTDFKAQRRGVVRLKELSPGERAKLIEEEPVYGNIICRCEEISEGEILDAIHRPLGARTLDGVKRRVRAGMGRCQGGFCSPRVMDILSRELDLPLSDIRKNAPDSEIVFEKTRGAGEG